MSNLVAETKDKKTYFVPRKYHENDPSKQYLSHMSPLDKYSFAFLERYEDASNIAGKIKSWLPSKLSRSGSREKSWYHEPFGNIFRLFEETGMYSKDLNSFRPTKKQLRAYYAAGSILKVDHRKDIIIDDFNQISYEEDLSYNGRSLELLMQHCGTYTRYATLNEIIDRNGRMYSPFVLRIMQEVGYATPSKPQMIQFA